MSADNLDGYDLKTALVDGLIHEDVMNTIIDLTQDIPTPLTDMIGSGTHGNEYTSWVEDALAAPNPLNAAIDGSVSTDNNAANGTRQGNHSQISTKRIAVSTRANESNTIGYAEEVTNQVSRRSQEIKRDTEAAMLANNASVAGTDAVAGVSGSLQSWLESNSNYASDGTAGAFDIGATGTTVTTAAVNGTPEALTETKIRDVAQSVYENGGDPTTLMMVPTVCRKLSEYMFTSSARIATLTSETTQSETAATAKGSVNVMVTDFNVILTFVGNRLQPNYDWATTDANSAAFLIDPSKLELSYLNGFRAEKEGKKGLSEEWLINGDWTLKVLNERAHGVVGSISNAATVTL
ncbi:MAG: hypothetical protein DRR06_19420 [Gammaproteobacteria bacterium]|nr:MAG: hypothetical protein DRR06_19420 [Gammaproteobacteria bacterium]